MIQAVRGTKLKQTLAFGSNPSSQYETLGITFIPYLVDNKLVATLNATFLYLQSVDSSSFYIESSLIKDDTYANTSVTDIDSLFPCNSSNATSQ